MFSRSLKLIEKRNRTAVINKFASSTSDIRRFEDIPSPRGLPIVGTTLALIAAGSAPKLHEYVDRRHKQLGPIYKEKIGPVHAVFTSDPQHMRTVFAHEGKCPMHVLPEAWILYNKIYGCSRGLFFMDGEEWLHFRRIMNKHLLKGDLKWIENACEVVSDLTLEKFKNTDPKDAAFPNLEQEFYLWSIHMIMATLLGAEAYKDSYLRIKILAQSLASKVHLIFLATSKLSLIPATLAVKFNIPSWKFFVSSVDNALKLSGDLVNTMLDHCCEGDGLLKRMKEENISRTDIKRIVSDLVLAAGDTTAYSMEWILYCLAKNPEVQDQLRHETINRDSLLKNILKESLRLYPVAPFLTRFLPGDCVIGGYSIPADTLMILSIYTSGRDVKYFTNPEEFRPDRWIRTESSTVNRCLMKHASLPFAMGARSCIGRKIAETQLQVTVGKIVDNFHISLCNKRNVDIVLKMVVVPSEPLQLKFSELKK